MRILSALLLALVGVGLLVFAFGPLHNLGADYKDSTDATYLMFGLPLLAFGIACLVAAALILRHAKGRPGKG